MKYRIFLAHAKSMDDSQIDQLTISVGKVFKEKNPSHDFIVTSGRDEFKKNMMLKGGWAGWAASVGAGVVDALTKEPRYHVICIPITLDDVANGSAVIGKGTASILASAVPAGRQIIAFDGENLHKVVGGNCIDQENWTGGWTITLEPPF